MVRQDNLLALQPLLHRDDASVEVVHLLDDFLAAGLASRAALLQGMQPRMRCREELLEAPKLGRRRFLGGVKCQNPAAGVFF